jgi:hypothetical protein
MVLLESFAKKFANVLTRRYLPSLSISLCYILRVQSLIRPPIFHIISLFGIWLTLQFLLMMRYKALAYLDPDHKSNAEYFNTFTSEKKSKKNRIYLRAKLTDEFFFILKILLVYFLRDHKMIALVVTLVTILSESIVTMLITRKMHAVQRVFIGIQHCSLWVFVLLMALKYQEIAGFAVLFDCIYILTNVSKIAEQVTEFIVVSKANKRHAQQKAALEQARLNPERKLGGKNRQFPKNGPKVTVTPR